MIKAPFRHSSYEQILIFVFAEPSGEKEITCFSLHKLIVNCCLPSLLLATVSESMTS